jgi:hypothetical protein
VDDRAPRGKHPVRTMSSVTCGPCIIVASARLAAWSFHQANPPQKNVIKQYIIFITKKQIPAA